MRRGPRLRVGAAVAAAAIAALVLVPTPKADAHDYLVSSSPVYNSTVTHPLTSVSLTFDAPVLDYGRSSTALLVTGPGTSTRHHETSCPRIADDTVGAAVALGGPGRYTITWRVVSADGHPVSDSIHFTYRPQAGTPASIGTVSGPACGEPTGRLSGAKYGAPGDTAGVSPVVWIAITGGAAAVLLAVLALVVVVVVLRRRPDAPE